MELSVKSHLYLPSFLPIWGNLKDLSLKKEILRKIIIPDEERKVIGFHENVENKHIEWGVEKEKPLAAGFPGDETEYLQKIRERIPDEELPGDMRATVSRIYDSTQGKQAVLSFCRYSFEKSAQSYSDAWSGFLLKYRSWQDRT